MKQRDLRVFALLLGGLMILAAEEAFPGALAALVRELKREPEPEGTRYWVQDLVTGKLCRRGVTQFQRDARA